MTKKKYNLTKVSIFTIKLRRYRNQLFDRSYFYENLSWFSNRSSGVITVCKRVTGNVREEKYTWTWLVESILARKCAISVPNECSRKNTIIWVVFTIRYRETYSRVSTFFCIYAIFSGFFFCQKRRFWQICGKDLGKMGSDGNSLYTVLTYP